MCKSARSAWWNSSTKDSTEVKFKHCVTQTTQKQMSQFTCFPFFSDRISALQRRSVCGYCHLPAPSLVESSPVCARSQCLPHVPQQTLSGGTLGTQCAANALAVPRGSCASVRHWPVATETRLRFPLQDAPPHAPRRNNDWVKNNRRTERWNQARDHPWRPVKGLEH